MKELPVNRCHQPTREQLAQPFQTSLSLTLQCTNLLEQDCPPPCNSCAEMTNPVHCPNWRSIARKHQYFGFRPRTPNVDPRPPDRLLRALAHDHALYQNWGDETDASARLLVCSSRSAIRRSIDRARPSPLPVPTCRCRRPPPHQIVRFVRTDNSGATLE